MFGFSLLSVIETANVWMSADITKSISILELQTSATFYIDVPDVNQVQLLNLIACHLVNAYFVFMYIIRL